MTAFTDQMMVKLSDPSQLREVLTPATDPTFQRIQSLFSAVYDLPFATVQGIKEVDIGRIEFQRPIFPLKRTSGTWTQTTPSHVRTEVVYEGHEVAMPTWLDLAVSLALTVVLQFDPGEVESIRIDELGDFRTLAEFKAKFHYFDLDAFIARQGIDTTGMQEPDIVKQLRTAFTDYMHGSIQLKSPPPASDHRFELQVAMLLRDPVDLTGALRDAKLAQAVLQRTLVYECSQPEGEVLTPYAPIVVLPSTGLTDSAIASGTAFFAREHILSLFTQP